MKRASLALIALLGAVAPASLFAVSGTPVYDAQYAPAGFQRITVLTSSTALTVPATSKLALIQAETQNVRWRDDGTPPTAAIGMLLETGQILVYNGDLAAIRFIETTASASLNITYLK